MIEMGLLWYEPSRGVPLADRIDAAAERYLERFGEAPNICLVAQSEVDDFKRIAVRCDRRIQPGYLLIGIERGEELAEWQPMHRSSDDVGVALLAPDGTVLRRLRPVARPKSAVRKKTTTRPAAKESNAPIALNATPSNAPKAAKSTAKGSPPTKAGEPQPIKTRATRTVTVTPEAPQRKTARR